MTMAGAMLDQSSIQHTGQNHYSGSDECDNYFNDRMFQWAESAKQ